MENSQNNENRPRIAVVGATGRTGLLVTGRLNESGYRVLALARNLQALAGQEAAGVVETAFADVQAESPESLAGKLAGCAAVICTLGVKPPFDEAAITGIEDLGVRKLVDATRQAGITRFILVTSLGTENPESMPYLAGVLRAKRQAELYLVSSGLSYTILRPGGLTDEPGGKPVQAGQGDTLRGRISRADLAEVVLAALDSPEAANQVFELINHPQGKSPAQAGFFAV